MSSSKVYIQDKDNKHFFTGKIYYRKKEAVAIDLIRDSKDALPFTSIVEADKELSRLIELGFDRLLIKELSEV